MLPDWDRLLNLLERYVVVEETKLRIGIEHADRRAELDARRAVLDERATVASEQLAKMGDGMKAEVTTRRAPPT